MPERSCTASQLTQSSCAVRDCTRSCAISQVVYEESHLRPTSIQGANEGGAQGIVGRLIWQPGADAVGLRVTGDPETGAARVAHSSPP
jgi:hypothetical protein